MRNVGLVGFYIFVQKVVRIDTSKLQDVSNLNIFLVNIYLVRRKGGL